MVFGAVADVLHYNVFPRLLSEIFTHLFGLPLLSFFGDFGAIIPAEISDAALLTFSLFCSKLGIKLQIEKSEVGRMVTFLGLEGDFPCEANNFRLSVTLTKEKAKIWTNRIRTYLKTGAISPKSWGSLSGRWASPRETSSGNSPVLSYVPIYRQLYARTYMAKLSVDAHQLLIWRADILSSLKPRVPRRFSQSPDFIVYTDSDLLSNRIAGLIMTLTDSGPMITLFCEAAVPQFWKSKFHRKNPIIGMEMLDPLALIHTAAPKFINKRVNLYIDNDTASNTLIRAGCQDPVLAAMIGQFWKKAEQLGADIWIVRVPSEVNPADLPTRGKDWPFPIMERVQFKNLFRLMCTTLRKSC